MIHGQSQELKLNVVVATLAATTLYFFQPKYHTYMSIDSTGSFRNGFRFRLPPPIENDFQSFKFNWQQMDVRSRWLCTWKNNEPSLIESTS